MRQTAFASLSGNARVDFALDISASLRFLVGGMAVERAGWRELAELVPDHVLADRNRNMLVAIVDAEGKADELRQYRRAPAPYFDDFVAAGSARRIRFLQHIAVDERTLGDRTRHGQPFFLLL